MRVGIIGAGASGMMAAVVAAEYGAQVTVIEKNDRVGKKILATGNGKCNLTNRDFNMEKYYCAHKEKLQHIFETFDVVHTLDFFEKRGLMIRDKNGYIYPYSEQAAVVLDFWRRLLCEKNINVQCGNPVLFSDYHKEKKCFIVKTAEKKYEFDKLIIACGGPASLKNGDGVSGYALAEKYGHSIKKTVPALVQLKSDEKFIKAMAGVRCQAKIMLCLNGREEATEQGEVQFTDYGISGIPVFQISRMASYAIEKKWDVNVIIDLFPDYADDEFTKMVRFRYENMKNVRLEDFLNGTVNKKINLALIKEYGYKPDDVISKIGYNAITELMQGYRGLRVHITGTNGMANAQVCAGGVKFDEINTNMESVMIPGLFFAGEVVDVDGVCGGYNLQWAWTSGYVAGKSAAN